MQGREQAEEYVYDVYWEGPYSLEQIEDAAPDNNQVLYAIYSTHPLYGRHVLVYIGMTTRGLPERIKEHSHWISHESNPVEIYTASIGAFTSWADAVNAEEYCAPSPDVIKAIESLLIIAHQPAYNIVSKASAEIAKKYRVFNTGKFGSLLPEVSGLYYIGDDSQ